MRSPNFYYAAFFATGIATVSTGALVALHGASVPSADGDTGRLVAAQFGGQLIGSYFVGRQVPSRLVLGASLAAVAMLVQVLGGHLFLPVLFVMGLGLGLAMASINTLVGLESPESLRPRRLEILNIFWPLGAAFGPWLLAGLPARHAFASLLIVLTLTFFALAVGAALRHGPQPAALELPPQSGSGLPLLISILALLAVGLESGLANWLPTFQGRYLPTATFPIPLATLFWGSILISRLLASRWLDGRGERAILAVSTLSAGLGTLGICLFHSPWVLAVAIAGTAVAIGPVYPLILTHAIKLPRRGVVFFCAAFGSAVFPWLIGRTATISHSLRAALLVPVVGGLLLFLLSLLRGFSDRRLSTPSSSGFSRTSGKGK